MRHHNGSYPTLHLLMAPLLIAGVIGCAADCHADGGAQTTVTFSGSLRNIFVEPSPATIATTDDWRGQLNRSLLPSGRAHLFVGAAGERDFSSWRPDDDRPMPVEVRSAFHDRAREETYRIASEILFSWGPINRIRQALEPYSRPLQLYRVTDGGVTAGLFDQKVAPKGSRVFNLRLELSPRHNLNVWAEIAGGVTIGFLEGRTGQIRWEPAKEDYRVALFQEGNDRTLLAASYSF